MSNIPRQARSIRHGRETGTARVELARLIEDEPLGTWRHYLTFKLLEAYAGVLPSEFGEAGFDFRGRVLAGAYYSTCDRGTGRTWRRRSG